jgi:hypothetical protein
MDQIQVVPRDAIPPMQSVEPDVATHELRELRDFRWNVLLREFMPASSRVSICWVKLGPGEELPPRANPLQALMVLYGGSGRLVGALERALEKDEVVVLPAGCRHGFIGGPDGLQAVLIQIGDGA